MRKIHWFNLGGVAVAVAVLVTAAAAADNPAPAARLGPAAVELKAEALRPSEYWIGLACLPADDPLRAQLGIDDGRGLLVQNVLPDGPAEKAGIQVYDVLVSAGGKPLGNLQDLIDAVDKAKEGKLSLELYRGGKLKKVDVTPVKRPDEMALPQPPPKGQPRWDDFRSYFEQFRPGEGGRPPMRFRYFHPGAVLPPGSRPLAAPLPGGMAVTIAKQGDEPAKITVKKGDQKWEVTEETLGELPEEVRKPVERMLGRVAPPAAGEAEPPTLDFDFDFFPGWIWRGAPPEGEAPPRLQPEGNFQKQFDQIREKIEQMLQQQEDVRKQREDQFRQQLDELRKRLEEFRQSRPRLKDSDKEEKKQQEA